MPLWICQDISLRQIYRHRLVGSNTIQDFFIYTAELSPAVFENNCSLYPHLPHLVLSFLLMLFYLSFLTKDWTANVKLHRSTRQTNSEQNITDVCLKHCKTPPSLWTSIETSEKPLHSKMTIFLLCLYSLVFKTLKFSAISEQLFPLNRSSSLVLIVNK